MVVVGAVLALVLAGAVCEFPVFTRAFFPKKEMTLTKRIEKFREKCAAQIPRPLRGGFVILNGLAVRMLGQHGCNGVVRAVRGDTLLEEGAQRKLKMRSQSAKVARFSSFCRENGIRFLYVQIPKKLDVGGRMLPPGANDFAYWNARSLFQGIVRAGVDVLDWCREFAATPDDVLANFYRTDHHWNTDTSFRAAGLLADEIAVRCGVPAAERNESKRMLLPDSWTRSVLPRAFLGSFGRRTGPCFAGKDDVIVLHPRFTTEMSFSVPMKQIRYAGSFEDTVMRQEHEIGSRNMFKDDPYSILYSGLGIRYPLVEHENPRAPLGVRVLLIGDSFARPVEGFLSTVVRNLHAVDPRRTKKGFSIARHVKQYRPDIVIQLQSALTFSDRRDADGGGMAMFEYGF